MVLSRVGTRDRVSSPLTCSVAPRLYLQPTTLQYGLGPGPLPLPTSTLHWLKEHLQGASSPGLLVLWAGLVGLGKPKEEALQTVENLYSLSSVFKWGASLGPSIGQG